MQFIEGQTLAAVIRQLRLGERQVLSSPLSPEGRGEMIPCLN
jgi:hypothetical protein